MSTNKIAIQRLQKDLAAVQNDDSIAAGPSGDDLFEWDAILEGPHGTPWEGAILRLTMKFPEDYPQRPPEVAFLTRVWHPNVYGCVNGKQRICLDLLQTQWSPTMTVTTLLVSIQSLLVDPNPASPANPEAAELFVKDRMTYDARVRKIAQESLAEAEAAASDDDDGDDGGDE